MKKSLTLFCMLLSASFICAQDFTFEPAFYEVDMTTEVDKKFGFTMENTSEDTLIWYWSVDLPEDFPQEWQVQICDLRLCYFEDNLKSSNGLPNIMEPGQITDPERQYVRIISNGVPGESYVVFNIYRGEDCTDLIYSTSTSTSLEDLESLAVSIYPNPTSEQVSLKNDDDVSKIVVTSMNGQIVYSQPHQVGQKHNVQDLATGMYIINLYNSDDRLMKMQQLYKK